MLIQDDQNRNMFERGSAKIMPFFKTLLVELAPVFDSLDNKSIITGHTDAMAYKNNIYNNWILSGDRALSARRVLEEAGMPEDKVMQVSAMADQMLLDSKNPQSAGNRHYYRAYRCDGLQKQYLQQLEPFGRSRAFSSSGAGRGRNAGR